MNRRQFLNACCSCLGVGGIAGMLWNSYGSHFIANPSGPPSTPVERDRFDTAEARRTFLNLEKLGFSGREAKYWEKTSRGRVRCTLCPTYCELRPYERGHCRVRFSLENRIVTVVYGKPCSIAVDPIEKKPVFHLLPGTTSFSLATAGCLLGCRYCQNWQISQARPEECEAFDLPPEKAVQSALAEGCRSIAYTYTEPTIFYEYMLDTAKQAHQAGLKNVVVSCGYINPEPLKELVPFIDVYKVDLKGFTEQFYRTICGGSLSPVLSTLQELARHQVLIDIVTLVVPTLNDNRETLNAMFHWIKDHVGSNVSLFLSRFYPTYQLRNLPPTPIDLVVRLREDAMAVGLSFVYLGNVTGHEGENTYCPSCRQLLIGRVGYSVTVNHLRNSACPHCGTRIPGIWE